MGNTPSSTFVSATALNAGTRPQLSPQEDYKNHVNNVVKAFEAFKGNDVGSLVQMMDKFNMDPKLQRAVLDQHEAILTSLGRDPRNDTKGYGNAQIQTYQQAHVKNVYEARKNLSPDTQKLLNDNVRIREGVNSIQDVVTGLHTKYKFFEFKYVEMNLFMMKFIDEIQELFEKSNNLYVAQLEAINAQNMAQFDAFVDSLKGLATTDSMEMYSQVENLSGATKARLEEIQKTFLSRANDMSKQRQDLLQIINNMVEKDVSLAKTIKNTALQTIAKSPSVNSNSR